MTRRTAGPPSCDPAGADALVDVVVVNWNTGPLLGECVRSVLSHAAGLVGRLVVVDNASTDASVPELDHLIGPVTLIRNECNRGFAAACNQGAAGSQARYLLFLNPDTRLAPGSLQIPIQYLEHTAPPNVAICGIRIVNSNGATEATNRRFPTVRTVIGDITRLSVPAPAVFPSSVLPVPVDPHPVEVDQVIGAFFLIRRPIFEALEGFDERFFVYYEEVDFSLRAHGRGYRSIYLPGAAVSHHGGYSSAQVPAQRLFYSLRSRTLFARKHWPTSHVLLLTVVTYLIELPARLAAAAARLRPRDAVGTLRAYWALTVWFVTGGRRPLP